MVLELAKEVYKSKYQQMLAMDQFFAYLQNGIDLLKSDSLGKTNNPMQMIAMNIALEYNMQVMVNELLQ